MKHLSRPQALLFDLGGVLIDIDFQRAFRKWECLSTLSVSEIGERFKFDVAYGRHERGEVTAIEYFDHLCENLSLRREHSLVMAGWNDIYVGEIAETVAMIRSVCTQIPCYALTNTNATHQAAWIVQFPAVTSLFKRVFSSHEMGHRKPEREAFEYISRELEVPLHSILFFDDLQENVHGARSAGLQAVHVQSPSNVRAALEDIGCAL